MVFQKPFMGLGLDSLYIHCTRLFGVNVCRKGRLDSRKAATIHQQGALCYSLPRNVHYALFWSLLVASAAKLAA